LAGACEGAERRAPTALEFVDMGGRDPVIVDSKAKDARSRRPFRQPGR
jgi:hypothetical protein